MGEVFKPETLTRPRRKPPLRPSPPAPPPQPLTPTTLYQEILELKQELEKVKRALKRHGIVVED